MSACRLFPTPASKCGRGCVCTLRPSHWVCFDGFETAVVSKCLSPGEQAQPLKNGDLSHSIIIGRFDAWPLLFVLEEEILPPRWVRRILIRQHMYVHRLHTCHVTRTGTYAHAGTKNSSKIWMKGFNSEVFSDGNELIFWIFFFVEFFFLMTSPLKEAHEPQLLLRINAKTNKDDKKKNCSSGIPELRLWFIVMEDQLWPHFALVLMSLCNPVLPDFVTPLLGSKSHLAATRNNRNDPLNPPCKTFSKQQSSLSIQQLNTSSLS